MKRIVVNINHEFNQNFKEAANVSFFDAVIGLLGKQFGNENITVIDRDDFNLQLEVNNGRQEVDSNALIKFIVDSLGVGNLFGKAFSISCYNVAPKEGGLFELPKIGESKFAKQVKKIKGLNEYLLDKVVGQEFAVNTVVNGFIETSTFKTKNDDRPKLTFFFAGPEGTGKSVLAKETVNYLEIPNVAFNSTDYTNADRVYAKISKLINANPNNCAIIFDDCDRFNMDMTSLVYGIYLNGQLGGLSFRNVTVFFTTNAGRSLYENTPRKNLSHLAKQDILDACGREIDKLTNSYCFHPLLLRMFQNEHVVMFNHLQTINYQFILVHHIEELINSFMENTGIAVKADAYELSKVVIYSNPEERDIKKLKEAAEKLLSNEIQYIVKQNGEEDKSLLLSIEQIAFDIDLKGAEKPVKTLFRDRMYKVLVASDDAEMEVIKNAAHETYEFIHASTLEQVKKDIKKGIDLVLVDPLFGLRDEELPVDIEDYNSVGNDIFEYVNRFYSRIPLFIISNTSYEKPYNAYQTLINKGVSELIHYSNDDVSNLANAIYADIAGFELENDVQALRKGNMHLEFNAKQEIKGKDAKVILSKLSLRPVALEHYNNKDADFRRIKNLDDVIGNDVCKDSLRKFGRYLSATSEYLEEGSLPPKLLIINGRNGTGKTSLVKALAEETSSCIISIDVKDFIIKQRDYVDEMQEAFKKARYSSPAIIHFQNINILFGGYENFDSIRAFETLNNELTYSYNDYYHPVIVIGECDPNYSVSPKLTEIATRFFRLPIPTVADIEKYIRKYLTDKNITTVSDKAIHNFALRNGFGTFGSTKKALEFALGNSGGKGLTDEVLKESFDVLMFGDIDLRKRSEHDLRTTAYHEIGHYILFRLFGIRPPFVTIVPRGYYNGYTLHEVKDESTHHTKQMNLNDICVSFGGRAAEVTLNGDKEGITSGISGDIVMATETAFMMVACYAMGDKLAAYTDDLPPEIRYQSPEIYDNVNRILDEQYARALKLIKLNEKSLIKLGEALLKNRSMTGDELEELLPDDKLIKEE